MQKVDWVAGALTGVLFLWACFMLGFFRNGRSERLARLKERGGQVEYEFSDELFKLRTNSERAELKWETFRALWIFSKAWLLLSKGGGYLTFPVDQTPAEARDFLKQKVAAVGAEVK